MKKIVLPLLLILSLQAKPQAGDSVKAVINKMFYAMLQGDAKLFAGCFTDSAVLQTITKNGAVKTENLQQFTEQIGRLAKNTADERIQFSAIHIDANLASVWTYYRFYYKGSFSHCGVNSFQLVRLNGEWKIQYLIDTRKKRALPGVIIYTSRSLLSRRRSPSGILRDSLLRRPAPASSLNHQ